MFLKRIFKFSLLICVLCFCLVAFLCFMVLFCAFCAFCVFCVLRSFLWFLLFCAFGHTKSFRKKFKTALITSFILLPFILSKCKIFCYYFIEIVDFKKLNLVKWIVQWWCGQTGVTSCELWVQRLLARVESSKAGTEIRKCEFRSTSYEFKSTK